MIQNVYRVMVRGTSRSTWLAKVELQKPAGNIARSGAHRQLAVNFLTVSLTVGATSPTGVMEVKSTKETQQPKQAMQHAWMDLQPQQNVYAVMVRGTSRSTWLAKVGLQKPAGNIARSGAHRQLAVNSSTVSLTVGATSPTGVMEVKSTKETQQPKQAGQPAWMILQPQQNHLPMHQQMHQQMLLPMHQQMHQQMLLPMHQQNPRQNHLPMIQPNRQ